MRKENKSGLRGIKLAIKPVLSKRARRMARKAFPKGKQIPSGSTLLYKMESSIDPNPQPTPKLLSDWAFLDKLSVQMFRKKFDNLRPVQKSKVIDSLHKEDQ